MTYRTTWSTWNAGGGICRHVMLLVGAPRAPLRPGTPGPAPDRTGSYFEQGAETDARVGQDHLQESACQPSPGPPGPAMSGLAGPQAAPAAQDAARVAAAGVGRGAARQRLHYHLDHRAPGAATAAAGGADAGRASFCASARAWKPGSMPAGPGRAWQGANPRNATLPTLCCRRRRASTDWWTCRSWAGCWRRGRLGPGLMCRRPGAHSHRCPQEGSPSSGSTP